MKICPRDVNHKNFTTTAVVCQDWLVDGEGNFIEVRDDCSEVYHNPRSENIWECDECGEEAVDRAD
jgi:hypothetical protein